MIKRLLFAVLLWATCAKGQTVHIEAETTSNSFGVQKLFSAEGTTGNKMVQFNAHDWADYPVSVSSNGYYKLSLRAAGTAGNVWVYDTAWNIIGKIALRKEIMGLATDQTYGTYSGNIFLKPGHGKIRLQARQAAYDYRGMSMSLDWVELTRTNLLVSTDFESDWDIFTGGMFPWKSANADSVNSVWESSPGFYGWMKQTGRPESFRLNINASGYNSYGVFELAKSDALLTPKWVRSEIYRSYSPSQTLYIAFDFMCPIDLNGDGLPHTFAQFHGAGPLSPPISFRVETIAGSPKYVMKVLWSAVPNPTIHQGETTYILGDYIQGQWSKWAIYVKFAYDNTGQLQVWRTEPGQAPVEVATRLNLPNCYNDGYYPYFKIGIYKWGWDGWASYTLGYDVLYHYYDNIRIGGASSSIAEVTN